MKVFLLIRITIILSTADGQVCQARLNQLINGQCSSINSCQGTILATTSCGQQRCCVSGMPLTTVQTCLAVDYFDTLYNTSRTRFLRGILNYGMNASGICHNCQAKAAFLAIAATMTNNFQTDEAIGNDTEFTADDNKYGNTQAGDGSLFRRRGFFGLRGRTMYQRLQMLAPQYGNLSNPEAAAIVENAIEIVAILWNNPNLSNGSTLTDYADGSFYGFSMLWYKLFGGIGDLAVAAQYYSTFLRQLYCGGDLYSGQGPVCQYNATHQGVCSADSIKGLENSSAYCGCGGAIGPQCAGSPRHIFCCLDTCAQELKMDLGFVLDASGSVGLVNYQLQLNFTAELLRQMNVGENKTHVSIINYSSGAEILTWLNKDYSLHEKLQLLANATYFSGGTDTALGLQKANMTFSYENGRRPLEEGATPVIFVITDGVSNDRLATISAADVLKESGILVVSVGVGSGPNLDELHAICSIPATENYFAISDYASLKRKLNQFTARSCTEPSFITLNMTMSGEIQKDKYKFLKLDITKIENKALITVALIDGMVELFYSFVNQNPKDPNDFIDYTAKLL